MSKACAKARLQVFLSGKVMFGGHEVDLTNPSHGRARHAILILKAVWLRKGEEITYKEICKHEKKVTAVGDQQRRYLSRFRTCLRKAVGITSSRSGRAARPKTGRKKKKKAMNDEQEMLARWIQAMVKSDRREGSVVVFRLGVPVEEVWFEK